MFTQQGPYIKFIVGKRAQDAAAYLKGWNKDGTNSTYPEFEGALYFDMSYQRIFLNGQMFGTWIGVSMDDNTNQIIHFETNGVKHTLSVASCDLLSFEPYQDGTIYIKNSHVKDGLMSMGDKATFEYMKHLLGIESRDTSSHTAIKQGRTLVTDPIINWVDYDAPNINPVPDDSPIDSSTSNE